VNGWQDFEPAQVVEFLTARMAKGLPGRAAQRVMAPRLAYGRHYGPVPDDARRAAVLIALHRSFLAGPADDDDSAVRAERHGGRSLQAENDGARSLQRLAGWSVPAIVRPETMKAHAGQVSLPGGLVESDETVVQTALREFEEELGAGAAALRVVGQLTPVYVFVSGFEVTPVVAVSEQPLVYQPNEHEVAAVLDLPVAELVDPARRGRHWIERRGLRFTAPHFAVGGQRVWGATALMLAEFVGLLD
jgi:8-oxo-dGTP pyrophosphatase MutT (NUDIX family)